jgi:malate/lactate dehydrogenase
MTEYTKDAPSETSFSWPRTVAVIGAAGLIGSGVVERLAVDGLAETVYMIDLRDNILHAHAIDISEAQILSASRTKLVVGPPADGSAVDLVIVAASAPETPEGDRRDFLLANLRLLQRLVPDIERLSGGEGTVMLLSNPVDVLAESLRRLSNISPDRIVGYSLNDSLRFRAAVARELLIAPDRVDGLVLGEHGNGQVPLFSALTIDGKPADLDPAQRTRVTEDITGWFFRWSQLKPGRSSGWTTPLGVAHIVRNMAEGKLHPATVWTKDLAGLPDSFVSLPARFTHRSVTAELGHIDTTERDQLIQAAKSVATAADDALGRLEGEN